MTKKAARPRNLTIPMTEQEYVSVQRKARAQRMTLAGYSREVLLRAELSLQIRNGTATQ